MSNTYVGVCGARQVVKAGSSVPANLTELGLVVLDGGMLESYSTLTGVKETKVTGSDANAAQGAGQGTFGCPLGERGEGRGARLVIQIRPIMLGGLILYYIVVDVCLFCMSYRWVHDGHGHQRAARGPERRQEAAAHRRLLVRHLLHTTHIWTSWH